MFSVFKGIHLFIVLEGMEICIPALLLSLSGEGLGYRKHEKRVTPTLNVLHYLPCPQLRFLFLRDLTSGFLSFSPVPLLSLRLVVKYPYVLFVETSLLPQTSSCALHQPSAPRSPPRPCQFQAAHLWPPPSIHFPNSNNPLILSRPSEQWPYYFDSFFTLRFSL